MFKHALTMVLTFLGIDAFAKVGEKSVISEAQKKQLAEEYGDQFLAKFEADLSKYESSGEDPLRVRLEERLSNLDQIVEKQRADLSALLSQNAALMGQVKKLADTPEPEPLVEFSTENGRRKMKFNIDRNAAHNRVAASYLTGDHRVLAAGETINVDSVVEEFNDLVNYVKLDVITQIFQGFETAAHLNWKRGIKSWKATRSLITSVVQQFVPKFTPLGDTTFTPIEIPLRRFKINALITPADVEDWIFNMYDESKDLDQHPVTIFIINKQIVPAAWDDIDDIIANGEFEELDWSGVSEGDQGQDPRKSIDGFLTQLRKERDKGSSSKMNYIDLGEISGSNILEKINFFVDSIDKKYKKKEMPVWIDPTLYRMYKRAYKDKYGAGSDKADDPKYGGDVIDYSRNRLVPLYNMTGSGALFTTPPENFIGLRHKNEPGATRLILRKYDYDIHCIGEFRLGVGFAIAEGVFYYMPDGDFDSGSGSGSGSDDSGSGSGSGSDDSSSGEL